MLRSTVDDCFNALHIGLPCAVGTSVGMAHLDAERHILVAELALCHAEAPPWNNLAEKTALV